MCGLRLLVAQHYWDARELEEGDGVGKDKLINERRGREGRRRL